MGWHRNSYSEKDVNYRKIVSEREKVRVRERERYREEKKRARGRG